MSTLTDLLGANLIATNELALFDADRIASIIGAPTTQHHLVQESGQEGILLSYSPRTDNVLAIILLACFLLISFALSRNKLFFSHLVKDFQQQRERSSIFKPSTAGDFRLLLLLSAQTCVLLGVCVFNYFNDLQPSIMERVSPPLLLAGYIALSLFYLVSKWLIYSFLLWIFFDKSSIKTCLESYSSIIYAVGFFLFPFVLFLVYFNLNIHLWVVLGCSLLVLTKILMFYKWIKLFYSNMNELFLLILYFCALEIMPCFMLYRGVVELNNYW